MQVQPIEPLMLPLDNGAAPASDAGRWLGGAAYGQRALVGPQLARRIGASAASACAVVDMVPLSAANGFAELWRVVGDQPLTQGRFGPNDEITWSADSSLLFAHLTLDEQSFGDGTHCRLRACGARRLQRPLRPAAAHRIRAPDPFLELPAAHQCR